MSGDVFAIIREELQSVHNTIKSQLTIKAGHIGNYAHLEFSPMDNFIRPAMVLSVARLYNCMSARVISLGAIVQFIFMASQVHVRIPETVDRTQNKGTDPRDGTQFPVLVGDYLYGKFFTTLCEHDLVHYLRPLAEIIGGIHEGGILNKIHPNAKDENSSLFRQIVRMETAELLAGSARLAGDLAGAPENEKALLYEFGLNLGIAYGFLQRGIGNNTVKNHLDKALQILNKLPNRQGKSMLERLVHMVIPEDGASRKVV